MHLHYTVHLLPVEQLAESRPQQPPASPVDRLSSASFSLGPDLTLCFVHRGP